MQRAVCSLYLPPPAVFIRLNLCSEWANLMEEVGVYREHNFW